MKVIDFHTHIYPDKISLKAVKSVGDFYNIEMSGGDGTSKCLIDQGKQAGIDNFVVHSVAVDGNHVETINNYIASECNNHSEFYGFGTMHAEYRNKLQEIDRICELGLRGVKIHPDTQLFNMDDERMFEVYDYLGEKNMPLLIHCGDYRYTFSHPERLCNILDRFPKLTVVGAHFGGWSVWDLAVEYLKDKNCYLDTSSSFAMIGLKRAKELIRIYGAERMVFGTDYPMWNVGHEFNNFMKIGLRDKENELILYKNALRLLGETN